MLDARCWRAVTKQQLRSEAREQLRDLSSNERAEASDRICRSLLQRRAVRDASVIAMFDPLPSEPDVANLRNLVVAARSGTRFCYPRCEEDGNLVFYIVDDDSHLLSIPKRDFREPDPTVCDRTAITEIDVVLVPGLAFTKDGKTRLGRGGGFYDRFLADPGLDATKLGICFAVQLRDTLPREPHDQPVDAIVTEASSP